MRAFMFAPLVLPLVAAIFVEAHATSIRLHVDPIAKVIQLLGDMQAKIVAEGDQAQKVFNEFTSWCAERSRNVDYEIKTGKATINDLEASIASANSNIMASTAEIEELASSISSNEADMKAATEIRKKEEADFLMEEKDLTDTIRVIERAIGILERELQKGGAMMLQLKRSNDVVKALQLMVDAAMIPLQDAQKLTALVQSRQEQADDDDDDMPPGAPAAAAYSSRSKGIVDILEDLLDKAKEELDGCRKKEANQKHAFKMMEQSLHNEIKFGEKEMESAKKAVSTNQESKASNEGELKVSTTNLKEDETDKETMHTDCMGSATEFEAATKSRGEELKAIMEAKKIIQDSTSGAQSVQYGLNQVSFLQFEEVNVMHSSEANVNHFEAVGAAAIHSSVDLAHFEAVQLVRDLARKNKDPNLALLAKRMAAMIREGTASGEDPFEKVKAMIRDLINKLLQEENGDISQKAYCDEEMGETSQKLLEKKAAVDKISTEIDSMSTRSAQLKEDIATLQKELSEIHSSQGAMDKIRTEEHEVFVKNKADMEQGLEGIKMATKVLREYYAQEGDAAHKAASGAGHSVLGMLEVVESDLSKGIAEMNVGESTAQGEHDRVTRESEISSATKGQGVKYKTKETKSLDSRVSESRSDLANTQEELRAVTEYDAKIKQICIAKPETFDQRRGRRQAEIQGLKEALRILSQDSEVGFVQRGQGKALRGGHLKAM